MNDELKTEYRNVRFRTEKENWPSTFHVVTAFNPDGQTVGASVNAEADSELLSLLKDRRIPHFRVTGGSQDFVHAEAGYGIFCAFEEAIKLARKFRQDAIFTVREGKVYLVSAKCDTPELEEVGSWADLHIGC